MLKRSRRSRLFVGGGEKDKNRTITIEPLARLSNQSPTILKKLLYKKQCHCDMGAFNRRCGRVLRI
jgi:hypothetical protein